MAYSFVGFASQKRDKGDTGTTLVIDTSGIDIQADDLLVTGNNALSAPVANPVDLSWSNWYNFVTESPGFSAALALGGETDVTYTIGGAVDMWVGLVAVYRNSHILDNSTVDLTGTEGFVTGTTPIARAETTGTTALDNTKKYHLMHFAYFDTPNNLTAIVPSSSDYTVRGYAQATDPAAPGGGLSRRRVLAIGDSLLEGASVPPYSTTSWAFTGTNTAPGTYLVSKSESPTQPSFETDPEADPSLGGLDLRLRRAKVDALPYQLHTRMLGE